MSVAEPEIRPMELPLLPDEVVEPVQEPEVDEGAGARLIGYATGHREGFRAGHDEGFRAGLAEGRATALAEAADRAERLAASIADSLGELRARWDADAERLAAAVTTMALEVATAVLDREVACLDDPGLDAVRRALKVLPESTDTSGAVLLLHPDDAEAFAGHPSLPDVRVVADAGIERGSCRLRAGDTDVDTSIAHALDRVREVLAS
jgi:flagellar assembly protein FliH